MAVSAEEVEDVRGMSKSEFRVMMWANLKELEGVCRRAGLAAEKTLEQQKITNGRVTRLELWQQRIVGALAVMAAGLPVMLWAATQVLDRVVK